MSLKLVPNGSRLCDVGGFKVQMFILAHKHNRIPKFKFSTSAPISQNRCYGRLVFSILILSINFSNVLSSIVSNSDLS